MEALAISERDGLARYASEQPPYNLLDRRIENELLPLCRKYGLGGPAVVAARRRHPRGPLQRRRARGLARRRADRSHGSGSRRPVSRSGARSAKLAAERGLTATQLALLWCKDQAGITAPIIGPRTLEQLEDALGILERHLDDETREALDALGAAGQRGRRLPQHRRLDPAARDR